MEKLILRDAERQLKNKAIIRHSDSSSRESPSCLSNLISFCDKVTRILDEGKAADVIFLDFTKAFDTGLHSILMNKWSNSKINRLTPHWVAQ